MASSQKDLDLLERVFLRFGSADTDEKLEKTVCRFLCPVLLKLSTPFPDARSKALDLLSHVSKQLKSRPQTLLPVEDLLQQYENRNLAPIIQNFNMVYLKMGILRLTAQEQSILLPRLIRCLENRPSPQQLSLLQLVVPLLGLLKVPDSAADPKAWLGIQSKPAVRRVLLDYLFDILLLPQGSAWSDGGSEAGVEASGVSRIGGLSAASYKQLTSGPSHINSKNVMTLKMGIIDFLACGVFDAEEVACHLLVATGNTVRSLAERTQTHMKRLIEPGMWEKSEIISRLFDFFLGTDAAEAAKIGLELVRPSANSHVQIIMVPVFLKSRQAAQQANRAMEIVSCCLEGQTMKHKEQGLMLLQHICENAPTALLQVHANRVVSTCYDITKDGEQSTHMRGLAYATLGKLSRRVPEPVRKETFLLRHMFAELSVTLDLDLRQSIYDCLMSCIPALREPDTDAAIMFQLAQDCMRHEAVQVRILAIKFSCGVFGMHHLPTLDLCLKATGDSEETVRHAASRALYGVREERATHGHQIRLPVSEKVAKFCDMLPYFSEMCEERLNRKMGHTVSSGVLPLSPTVYVQMLTYLHGCLLHNAGVTVEKLVVGNYQTTVATYLNSCNLSDEAIWRLCWQLINNVLSLRSLSGDVHSCALALLVDVSFANPAAYGQKVEEHFALLKEFLCAANEDVRNSAAKLMSVIALTLAGERLSVFCKEIFELLSGNVESLCGGMLALGAIMSSLKYNVNGSQEELAQGQFASDLALAICKYLGAASVPVFMSACQALGDLASSFLLPIADGSDDDPKLEEASPVESGASKKVMLVQAKWSKLAVVKELSKRIRTCTDSRLQERAALAMGTLLIGEPAALHRQHVLDGLLDARKLPQAEVQFVIGEALSFVAVGSRSSAAPVNPLSYTFSKDLDEQSDVEAIPCPHVKDTLAAVLKLCKADNEISRQSACVWLLCLIKHCGHVPAMQEYLVDIQTTFIAMLTERNDIVQEVASRGLSLVFEHSPAEQRDALVDILRDTLLRGKRSGRHVDKKTKILDEDVIGKQPEGAGISTYEELCSMANDLNQPDLVYKFMNLANHHAIWNSKKGAAFGVSMIAEHCKEELQEHLGSIIPKLYHYQYDPNVKVQLAMTNIWKAVVSDSQKAIVEHFVPILEELQAEVVNSQWRVRQSCCLALADFLRGVVARRELVDALPSLWIACLRVRDDVKESVRTAADAACTSLSKVTIRVCDSSRGESGRHAIGLVLPVLLEKGMKSAVTEVKTISLATILQISKHTGALLKPHIAVMVPMLLEGLTELEPKVLSYIALHVGADSEEMQDKLDSARISASKISPLTEVATQCLHHVDKDILGDLVNALIPLLKSGVGLGTKAGCADFVVSLCNRCGDDVMPYAGKLLAALLHGLADRSSGVRRSYASCTGNVVKNAKESSVEKLIERMRVWYMEKEDEELHHSAALVLHAISRHAPDVLQRHSSSALPLTFLAMHAKEKPSTQTADEKNTLDTLSLWQEIWQENTPGTEGGIRVHHTELISLTISTLTTSSSWLLKRQAAASASTIAQKLGSGLSASERNALLKSLLAVVEGRIWDGKDAVYQAVADLASSPTTASTASSSAAGDNEPVSSAQIVDCMIEQCRKKRYRREALQCTGRILAAVSLDRMAVMFEVVKPFIVQSTNQGSDSDDSDGEGTKHERRREKDLLRAAAFTAVGQAWPRDLVAVDPCEPIMEIVIESLASASWRVKVAILNCLSSFASRCDSSAMDEENRTLALVLCIRLLPTVAVHLTDAKFTAVQAAALKTLESLLALSDDIPMLDDLDVKKVVHQQIMAVLKLSSASGLHSRCKTLRQKHFTFMQ